MYWCPRCRGVLLSPASIDAPAERRNYRWVARRPDQRVRHAVPPAPQDKPAATPRYHATPRWGLQDPPPQQQPAPRRPLDRFVGWLGTLLVWTAAMFGVAAVAELLRYGVLLRNRTRLIHPAVLFFSDALVFVAGVLALVLALLTAVAAVGWLIETRRVAYAHAGRLDPRRARWLIAGCVVPVVNLLLPGVFLTELVADRPDPRALRAVRVWWAAWVFGGLLTVAALYWRTADSLQAKADGVMFTAFADLVAAGVTVLTLWVIRTVEGRDLRGRDRIARRWLNAVDPMVPVIEPVHPSGRDHRRAEEQGARESGSDNGAIEHPATGADAVDHAHEEVMAK
ncbi:DUF4328 domain-containing protein [Nocardia callitridis]|uniref:DUF4328 domain-containing protein n=2 Tax=Nocardia callitridis TaxID=648753 RepID=A0ABP9JXM2_9NOCA